MEFPWSDLKKIVIVLGRDKLKGMPTEDTLVKYTMANYRTIVRHRVFKDRIKDRLYAYWQSERGHNQGRGRHPDSLIEVLRGWSNSRGYLKRSEYEKFLMRDIFGIANETVALHLATKLEIHLGDGADELRKCRDNLISIAKLVEHRPQSLSYKRVSCLLTDFSSNLAAVTKTLPEIESYLSVEDFRGALATFEQRITGSAKKHPEIVNLQRRLYKSQRAFNQGSRDGAKR